MKLKVAGILCALLAQPVLADVYHYIDDKGRKIFVDRMSQVPPQFRDQLEVRKELASKGRPEQAKDSISAESSGPEVSGKTGDTNLAQIEADMKKLEQPVGIENNSVRVPVILKYLNRTVSAALILDTGASHTLVYRNSIRTLGAIPKHSGFATVVGGAKLPAGVVKLNSMSFGPIKRTNAEVLVIEPESTQEYDGLLGMDILSEVKFEVDFERKLLIWEADRYRELARTRDELLAGAK
ncbi:retropepsin-like aspartic protease [Idiomarina abyssalis]|uniref:retropepsin-like aspartic protease n=1 Tax=Idiomarina abyssalis TaxID=86102 RepID=UPI003A956024